MPYSSFRDKEQVFSREQRRTSRVIGPAMQEEKARLGGNRHLIASVMAGPPVLQILLGEKPDIP
jgi:hypothetical protein